MARKSRRKKMPIVARRRTDAEKDAASWHEFSEIDSDHSYSTGAMAVRWWTCPESKEAGGRLWLWIDRLRQRWAVDGIADLIHEAIYADEPLGMGFDSAAGALAYGASNYPRQAPANLNIVMSMVDTVVARLTKRRPMPVISADDADYTEKRFAKNVSRVLRRKMGATDVERMRPHVLRDMAIRGTGCAMVDRMDGDTVVKRIPIYELVYDPREAYYSQEPSDGVRTLARVHPVQRELLLARYPEHREEILKAPAFNRSDPWMMYVYQGPTFADHVEVAHSWHLPSGRDCADGQEIVALRNCVLKRRVWRRPRFPIARCFWNAPHRGFRGRGLVQQLAGIQMKVNDILRDEQEALYHGSQLTIFLQRTANVLKNHLRGRHPKVVEYDGQPPSYVAPDPVSRQAIEILLLLIEQAYKISGISEIAAQGKNPLGQQASGRALDAMDDLQSDRFAHIESSYQQWSVELGTLQIDEARDMYEEAKRGAVEVPEGEDWPTGEPCTMQDLSPWIRENEWDRVDIDSGEYHCVLEPANFLPETRGGRLAGVNELAKNGLIPDPTMTAALFDEPDMVRMNRPILGPIRNIERMIDDLCNTKLPLSECLPGIYSNRALFLLMAKGEFEFAQAERASEDVLERIDQAIKYVKDLEDAEAMASPSMPGMQAVQMGPSPNAATLPPGMPPGGAPMPPAAPMPGPGAAPGMAAA
jgi:hypothetical protein